jgi:hypothetical protein
MTRLVLVLALGAALIGVGCDEKKSATDTLRSDAGVDKVDKYATADPKLERALKAVSSASGASDNGPPPTGIFALGMADQRHARGVPTKVDILEGGGEPRIGVPAASPGGTLPEASRATSYGPAALQVAIQMGPRSVIAVDYGLLLGPAKKDDGGPEWLVAEVRRAAPAKGLGPLESGSDKDIASLEGTQFRIQLAANGQESEVETRLAKAAKADLDRLARSAAEFLMLSLVAPPPKPVGVGAQWIAETRMPLSGLDVIAYRAYRVKSIEGDRIHLTLEMKAYAADKEVQLAGIPKGASLEQFEATAHGELDVVRGELLARKSDMQQRVVMVFAGPGGPQPSTQAGQPGGNMLTAQLQSQATLVRGEDLRAASKQP